MKKNRKNYILKRIERHIDLKLQDKVSFERINNIFFKFQAEYIWYIVHQLKWIQDDECPIKGVIELNLDDNKVIVSKINRIMERMMERAILKKIRHHFIFGE